MKKTMIIAVASFFFCMQSAYPQIMTNELPVSVQRGLGVITKDKTTGAIDLPVPDIKKLLQEDSLMREKNSNGLQRTAVSISVIIDVNKDGIWSTLEDGGRLWQMEIHAEKALALDFVFSKFWLPKEGKFFLFNPSTKETIGAITSKYLFGDKDKPHRFSTGVLKGDRIILEYYQPAGEKELPVIRVEKAYYTYTPAPNFLSQYTCFYEVNVNCSEGSNWQLEKNAVALVYWKNGDYGGWCSGSLVNNTQSNLAPLFLTANHCVGTKDAISDNDLSDWVFYWGYELESCFSTTQPNYYTTIGATLLANNSLSDFAILQLQQDPISLPGYIPYYLGWDASGSSGTGGVCIHHPRHDVKKISTYSCTPQTVSYNSFLDVYWGVQWSVTANGCGITEPGSSGSPLINNNHRVIGQLAGGDVSCTYLTGTDKYGKLSISWTGGGNNDYRRRLDYWLDPNGTNTQTINGLYPYNLSGPFTICTASPGTYSISNLQSFYTVSWNIDDSDFSITPSGNQCTVTFTGSQEYDYANLTANICYNNNLIKQFTKPIIAGTPPLGADILIMGGDGILGRWTSNLTGNTVDIEELFNDPYYMQYEANLYRISPITFEPETTPIRHWSFGGTHYIVDYLNPGWYMLEVRGINSCGTSDWIGTEVECVDTDMLRSNGNETELTIMYSRQGQMLTVSVNQATRSTTDNAYTIQLWNELNMVRELRPNDPVIQIPMTGLKNGLYTVRYVNRDEVIAKKFMKF